MAFHAAPPPGEWLNDPNGLVHNASGWTLFAQHRADAPRFAATNWARLSSADLLHWRWDGAVIPASGDAQAYSGSVVAVGTGLEAFHTVHVAGHEHQERRGSDDGGHGWQTLPLAMPAVAAGADVRDPAVFGGPREWGMLLAQPCPWDGGETAPASRLIVLRSPDRAVWTQIATIGPWHPAGVMWEVPAIIRRDDGDLLLISCVDRRGNGADCAVFAWAGRLSATGFAVAAGWPTSGRRVDLGPDFYAAIGGTDGQAAPVIGWLASWATARILAWPGFAGGPISLPRQISRRGNRLVHTVMPAVAAAFSVPAGAPPTAGRGSADFDGAAGFVLTIAAAAATATLVGDPALETLAVTRRGAGIDWHREHDEALLPALRRSVMIFRDGPAIEVFFEPDGVAVSLGLPGDLPATVTLTVGGVPAPLAWHVLPARHGEAA